MTSQWLTFEFKGRVASQELLCSMYSSRRLMHKSQTRWEPRYNYTTLVPCNHKLILLQRCYLLHFRSHPDPPRSGCYACIYTGISLSVALLSTHDLPGVYRSIASGFLVKRRRHVIYRGPFTKQPIHLGLVTFKEAGGSQSGYW